jgi:hypothetical protein
MSTVPTLPEFSRIVPFARVRDGWTSETAVASADERAALARRFDLVELSALEATVRLRRARAGRYVEIDGALKAAVVQSCVVTLDPVPAALDERFTLMLGPIGGVDAPEGGELIVDLDQPEPLDGDDIDIGELVAQQLSLALDPYPRSAGAEAAIADAAGAADPAPAESPFAVLQRRGKPK